MKKLLSLFVVALTGLTQTGAQTTVQWPEVNHEAKPASRWWIMGSAFDETYWGSVLLGFSDTLADTAM